MDDRSPDRVAILLLALGFEGALGLVALGLGWLTGWPASADLRWTLSDALTGMLVATPLLVFFVASRKWPIGSLQSIKDVLDDCVRPLLGSCSILELLAISLVAGLGEELLFRGWLQSMLGGWLGPTAGLVGASVLFGLAHSVTRTYAVIAAVIGACLGWVWLLTGNLLVPIIAHGFYDFVALVYFLRCERPQFSIDAEATRAEDLSPGHDEPPSADDAAADAADGD